MENLMKEKHISQVYSNCDGIKLTDNLFVKDLHIINCHNIVLPYNLHVIGNLIIEKCNNITFNGSTQIDNDFILKDCESINIPLAIKFNGNIKFDHVTFNTLNLPLLVKGDLHIKHTNISSLPDNLTVNGDLKIEKSPIKELPINLKVYHSVLIQDTNINKIKDGLICENIILPNNVVSFPNEYIVTNKIGGKYDILDKLDFKKHLCNYICISDNGLYEHRIYDNYRATIVYGLPILVKKEKTHVWKMYDKEYIYVDDKIIEVTN